MCARDDKPPKPQLGKGRRYASFYVRPADPLEGLLDFKFDMFPEHLRLGPWSPSARLGIAAIIVSLAATYSSAVETFQPGAADASFWPTCVHAVGALWGCLILGVTFYFAGVWPFFSYTMLSWCLMTARHVLGALRLPVLASPLLFPSLSQNFITVSLWWVFLVPVIALSSAPSARADFLRFNANPLLFNVHLLNLPLALADWAVAPRLLTPFDYWFAIVIGVSYLIFYLSFLDPRGLHFYIFLSPRPHYAGLSYIGLAGLYYALYRLANAAAVSFSLA